MKRYKRLAVLAGLLIIACIATFGLSRYEEKKEQIKNSDEIILEIPSDSVTSLSWEYGSETLSFHKDEKWLYDEDEAFPVDGEKVTELLAQFESFGVCFIIEEVEDFSQYGLDDPICTISIGTEAQTYEITLGNFSTMDSERYVSIGDGNVYLAADDPLEQYDAVLSDMIDHDEMPDFGQVTQLSFSGAESYTVAYEEASAKSYSAEDVYFTEEGKPLDTSSVESYLRTISDLDPTDYVTYNATDAELESYGLTNPELTVTVNYTYENEDGEEVADTFVLHVGSVVTEAGSEDAEDEVTAYVRVGESQIVYQISSDSYTALTAASYDSLRHKEVLWADFADVYQMDITLEETEHTLSSTVNEEGEQLWYYGEVPAAEDTATEAADATQAEEQDDTLDISALQSALEALSAESFTDEAPAEKEEIRLTVYLNNENHPKTEIILYRYDGTNCLAVVNGESVSLVSRSSVMALVEAVQAIVLN